MVKTQPTKKEKQGLVTSIDRLYAVRTELKMLKREEEELAAAIKEYMLDHKLDKIEGNVADATISKKERLEIEPEAFFEAVNESLEKLFACASIRLDANPEKELDGARSYLGEKEIAEIADAIPSVTLRIPRKPADKIKKPK